MPINEYSDTETGARENGQNVFVEIRSVQNDMTGTGLFGTVADIKADGSASGDEAYTLTTGGILTRGDDGTVELLYDESGADKEQEASRTLVSFHEKKPGCVTVTRSGGVSASFIIEEKVRRMSVYNTPYGAFEMCVLAKKVRNSLDTDGGKIELDYIVELKGLSAQHTKMTIKVRPFEA